MQRWSEVEKSQTKVIQDEVDLRRIRDKAVQDLERAKNETNRLK